MIPSSLPPTTLTKIRVAQLASRLGASRLGMRLQSAWSPYVRIVYYHDVPPAAAPAFEQQLRFLSRHYVAATRPELDAVIDGERWPHRRPGVILTFDDGLRSHAEVVAPLLEKYGHQGWFFAPIGLVLLDPAQQPEAARRHLVLHQHDTSADPRVFMTEAQLRGLAQRHFVGCHTDSHCRMSASLTPSQVHSEIVSARDLLAAHIGQAVDSFAWVGGEESAYSSTAASVAARSFRYVFTTNCAAVRAGTSRLELQRTHLEAWFPPSLVELHLSGLMDLYYGPKRRRLATVLAPMRGSDGGSGILQIPG